MSLAHSRAPKHTGGADEPRPVRKEGWVLASSQRSEERPRFISQPKSGADEASQDSAKNPQQAVYIHPSGNSKPAEPLFLQRRPSNSREAPRQAGHIHPRPWTTCPAPGRKEHPYQESKFHRTWMSDCGVSGRPLAPATRDDAGKSRDNFENHGEAPRHFDARAELREQGEARRWTRARKKEHYAKYDQEMADAKCSDERFAVGTNAKMWTHLLNGGVTPGGQLEKLDAAPSRKSGLHLKSGIYKGKFANVQHSQVILRARRGQKTKDSEERVVDTRPQFDNRLKDDMIRQNDKTDVELAAGAFDLIRPLYTRSCPQMGAEWMHR